MISFREYFELIHENYVPRPGDVFFHGSQGDFEQLDARGGLVYVTRNLEHAKEYAEPRSASFGGKLSKPGFVYAYKIDPRAKIFDAKDSKNFVGMFKKGFNSMYGYTEIIQQDDIMSKILSNGWDGVLQKQADLGLYGDFLPKSVKRYEYSKREGKEKYRTRVPIQYEDYPFRGVEVLGIKPEFLHLVKKIPWVEVPSGSGKLYKNAKNL